MSAAKWPKQREGGGISVSVRFSTDGPVRLQEIEELIDSLVAERRAAGSDVLTELLSLPRVQTPSPGTVDVVFDARPGSRKWKGWMVYIGREIASGCNGLTSVAFIDLVGGGVRPISPQD